MENHPIPQDITGFQFKLIGNMTVRQFVYFAVGAVIAAFVFFILPIPFIIRLPIAFISVTIGASFAFIPIGGRPMDTMVGNFFKALFAPTKYIYQKTGGDLSSQALQPQQMQTPAATPPASPPPPPAAAAAFDAALPSIVPSVTASELEKLLEETKRQKEALEKELEALRATPPQPLVQPQPVQPPPPPPPASPPPPAPKQAVGLPIPESPNLIIGIVNDPRGNPLQNILVEVKDQEENPVRAFKTNGLGQFAAATSLANGKYLLVFEDPKGVNKFDSVQIEAIGNPIPPIQITSVDPREELRRQLFN